MLELALQHYEEQLWRSERALGYLRARGIPEDLARKVRLGYAGGHSLLPHLSQTPDIGGISALALAVDLGLLVERQADDAPLLRREFFTDRLIAPELRADQSIWCNGRAIEDPSTTPAAPDAEPAPAAGRARPKYLSLPGEKPVLGLEQVAGRSVAYLVEGPVDWLAGLGWGLPTFAICGTYFPADRLPSLAEVRAIYGVFDPDRAGRSAAERFAPLFGSRWRPIRLPNNLDLADLAAHGEAGLETLRVLVGRARAAAGRSAAGAGQDRARGVPGRIAAWCVRAGGCQ